MPPPMPALTRKPGVRLPQEVCTGNPCWCNHHPELGAPRQDGRQPWTQEGHDRFMRERFKQHGQKVQPRKELTETQRIMRWIMTYSRPVNVVAAVKERIK